MIPVAILILKVKSQSLVKARQPLKTLKVAIGHFPSKILGCCHHSLLMIAKHVKGAWSKSIDSKDGILRTTQQPSIAADRGKNLHTP